MKTKETEAAIKYSVGGISHTEESFSQLVEKNLGVISRMVNVEERIKKIRESSAQAPKSSAVTAKKK